MTEKMNRPSYDELPFAHPTKGFYNGFTMADVLDRGKVGIHNPAVKGIVGRGLLADVAPLRAPFDGQDQIGSYLSAEHRGDPACGCTLGALAADAGRKGPAVQARFAEALEGMTRALGEYLARRPSRGKRARAHRERALQMLSELVGALVLARAVAVADPALSDEILAANRRGLG